MTYFLYIAKDKDGNLLRETQEAPDKDELIRTLHRRGFTVLSVTEVKTALKEKAKPRRLRRRLRLSDLTLFARQMAILLEAGVPILRTIQILKNQVQSRRLFDAVEGIEQDIKAGASLRDAIARQPRVFSSIWVDLVETGEATGQLSNVLRQLSNYFEIMSGLRRKIISALIYPCILIIVSLICMFIFMYRVIPEFKLVYETLGGAQLPALTLFVINVSDFMRRNFVYGLICVIILIVFLRLYLKTRQGRRFFDNLKLRLPLLGDFLLSVYIERFTSSLSMLLKGGVSIIRALEISIKVVANDIIESSLERVRSSVMQGKSLSKPLTEESIFPPLVSQMMEVGEETGRLSQILDDVSGYYLDVINTKITRLTNFFEPAILIVMGGIIGVLITAMYMPIFKLAAEFGRI